MELALYRVLDRRDAPTQAVGARVVQYGYSQTTAFNQKYLDSPTVFNFYLPDYSVPNSGLDRRSLEAPELQIVNELTVFAAMNRHRAVSITQDDTQGKEPNVYDKFRGFADDPEQLVDEVNALLMYGRMSLEMKAILVQTLESMSGDTDRVRAAVWLTVACPEFQVIN